MSDNDDKGFGDEVLDSTEESDETLIDDTEDFEDLEEEEVDSDDSEDYDDISDAEVKYSDDEEENENYELSSGIKVADEETTDIPNDETDIGMKDTVDTINDDDDKSVAVETRKDDDIDQVQIPEPVAPATITRKKRTSNKAFDALDVDLTFETSRKQITLGELKSIHTGYTFVSQNPVTSPIEIRANGKLIGYGKLVSVENNIGIQITELI